VNENEFYQELGVVPTCDEKVYKHIAKRISRRKNSFRIVYSLAASVLIVASVALVKNQNIVQSASVNTELTQEVALELQKMGEYLDGSSIDDDLDLYVYSSVY